MRFHGQAWCVETKVVKPTGEVSRIAYLAIAPTKTGGTRAALRSARRVGRVQWYLTTGPLKGPFATPWAETIFYSNEHVAANGKPIDGYPLQQA